MIREKRLAAIDRHIAQYMRTRYTMIDVVPMQGMFNYRCHENSVQWALSKPNYEVVEVIYLGEGAPILHYINYNTQNGKYYETTLGWRAEGLEYYKIRTIHRSDWKCIGAEFSRSLDSWKLQFTTWFDRTILRINRIL